MQKPAALFLTSFLAACAATTHPVAPAPLGTPRSGADLLAVLRQPGPVVLQTVNSGDWAVPLAGLLNLDHPLAEAAGLEDRSEPIQVYFHVLRHPRRGTFVVDTGLEKALRDAPDQAAIRGLVASVMGLEALKIHRPLGDFLAEEGAPLQGVFLTHLHLDHLGGLPDVPKTVPVYAGPGDAQERSFGHMFIQGIGDEILAGRPAIQEWAFSAGEDIFAGIIDIFGDGSVWALSVPGHTAGSTAYLVRTPDGPVLLVGDACHTAWGWQNSVEPGDFSENQERSRVSLLRLKKLVAEYPQIQVRLGHQRLPEAGR